MKETAGQGPAAERSVDLTAACEHCCKPFSPHPTSAGRFCSHSCYAESLRKHPTPEPRVCERCGTSFTPEPHNPGRFCSRGCKNEAQRRRPPPEPQACERCGDVFLPHPASVGRFCSHECDYAARAKYPEPGLRTCAREGCDRRFRPYPSHAAQGPTRARFCSYRCRMRAAWRTPGGVSEAMLVTARMRQRWLGLWASRKPPKPGSEPRGRPRAEISPEQLEQIDRLRARGWGRPAIAQQIGLSEKLVRRRLHELTLLGQERSPTLFGQPDP